MLIYSGDFDGQIPYLGTEAWTTGMGYAEKEGGAWRAWTLNDDDVSNGTVGGTPSGAVAGHVTSYDVPTEFTFLTVAQAGHMVSTSTSTSPAAFDRAAGQTPTRESPTRRHPTRAGPGLQGDRGTGHAQALLGSRGLLRGGWVPTLVEARPSNGCNGRRR